MIAAVFSNFQRNAPRRFADQFIPGASFLLVRVPDHPAPTTVLAVKEMVARLRDNGLPIAAIAEIAKVERKTVYAWLDGSDVRGANATRVETLFRLLNAATTDFRALHRCWNRKLQSGLTIKQLLCVDDLSEMAISDALSELSPAIRRHAARDVLTGPRLSVSKNPAIDEMPTAVIER